MAKQLHLNNLINQIYFKFKSKYISYGINACRVFREGTVAKDAGWWGDEKQGVILPTEMRTCEHTLSREPVLLRYIREHIPKSRILPRLPPSLFS
jgi:hypothetical protein